jgi:chromatin structure-remodeling complex subunit RSC1/2
MPITPEQKIAIEEVITALLAITTSRGKVKRQLAAIFMDLVDRTDWPEYYEV